MKIVDFATPEQKALGLQYFPWIPDDTVYRFMNVRPGTIFHSRNVPEPFEILFFSASGYLITRTTMTPPDQLVQAPTGTSYALEARPGVLPGL